MGRGLWTREIEASFEEERDEEIEMSICAVGKSF